MVEYIGKSDHIDPAEKVREDPRWTDREIQILKDEGIVVLDLKGDSLQDQLKARDH